MEMRTRRRRSEKLLKHFTIQEVSSHKVTMKGGRRSDEMKENEVNVE
jgi:hypothetical protein